MLTSNARSVSENRLMLLPDVDEDGEAGFKSLTRKLVKAGVEVRSYGERPPNVCEPEQLSEEEWKQTLGRSA